MFANQRREKICEIVNEKGNVSVDALTELFQVSAETVRRDLIVLEVHGNLKRVHGGAVSTKGVNRYGSLEKRLDINKQKKHELAVTAIQLLQNDDIISIDSGSTCIEFVDVIKQKFDRMTILTNSLDVVEQLGNKEGFKIYLTGGIYMPNENAFYGDTAVKVIKSFCIPKAFIFPSGVSVENGVSEYNSFLSAVQKAYIEAAEEVIVMADSSKIGHNAFIKNSDITEDFIIVTDSDADKEVLRTFTDNEITVLTRVEEGEENEK